MEQPTLAALTAATAAGGFYLLIVGALLRATSGKHAMVIMATTAALLLAAVPIMVGNVGSFWHFAAFFGAAVSLTVFLYGALLKSLSLAMLVEISRARDHLLSLDDLTERVVRPAFAARARLLVQSGAATCDGSEYVITPQGQHTAKRIAAVRRFLRIDSPGLYGP